MQDVATVQRPTIVWTKLAEPERLSEEELAQLNASLVRE